MAKLPVWHLIVLAHRFIVREFNSIVRVAVVPFFLLAFVQALSVFIATLLHDVPGGEFGVWALIVTSLVVKLCIYSIVIAALYRLIVLDEQPAAGFLSSLRFGQAERAVAMLFVQLLALTAVGGGALQVAAVFLLDRLHVEPESPLVKVVLAIAAVPVLFAWLRLAFMWPVSSTRFEYAWRESWRLTQRDWMRLGTAFVAVSILPLVVVWLLDWALTHLTNADSTVTFVDTFVLILSLSLHASVVGNAYLIVRANDAEPGEAALQPAG